MAAFMRRRRWEVKVSTASSSFTCESFENKPYYRSRMVAEPAVQSMDLGDDAAGESERRMKSENPQVLGSYIGDLPDEFNGNENPHKSPQENPKDPWTVWFENDKDKATTSNHNKKTKQSIRKTKTWERDETGKWVSTAEEKETEEEQEGPEEKEEKGPEGDEGRQEVKWWRRNEERKQQRPAQTQDRRRKRTEEDK